MTEVPNEILWIAAVGLVLVVVFILAILVSVLMIISKIRKVANSVQEVVDNVSEPLQEAAERANDALRAASAKNLVKPLLNAVGGITGLNKTVRDVTRKARRRRR